MCTSIRNGNTLDFDQVLHEVDMPIDQATRNALLAGLACTKDQSQLIKVLERELQSNILNVLTSAAQNFNGYLLAWEFLKDEWESIYGRYDINFNYFI